MGKPSFFATERLARGGRFVRRQEGDGWRHAAKAQNHGSSPRIGEFLADSQVFGHDVQVWEVLPPMSETQATRNRGIATSSKGHYW